MNLGERLKSLLPGIFLFGYTIGTGSVTAMAKAGADYGMTLLWTVLLSCLITFFLIHLYGKFTVVTGETALSAFRRYIHPGVGIFFIIALGVNISGSIIGVMGILSDVCYEWSKNYTDGGIAPIYFAGVFITLVYLLFLDGRTRVFKKVLMVIVAIMAICFLINFFVLAPAPLEMAKGLIPVVPVNEFGEGPFLVIASMVGTTVFSGLFILRTTLVRDAQWTMKDLKTQRNDALFSAFLMFVVSASIMASAAGTLHVRGIRLENVSEMIGLLEPLAGLLAVSIFTIGLVAAGVSSQFPNVALVPWLLDDYNRWAPNMRRFGYRALVLFLSLLGFIVPVFQARPVSVMIASQAFGALILPVTVACLIFVGNKKSLMGRHSLSLLNNLFLFLILLFALAMSYMGISGLVGSLKTL